VRAWTHVQARIVAQPEIPLRFGKDLNHAPFGGATWKGVGLAAACRPILRADFDHRKTDQKPVANEMRMTKKPKTTVPMKTLPSSLKVFIARIAAIPTTGTVTIPVTYPKTQIPPSREYTTTIKNGIRAIAIRKSSATVFPIVVVIIVLGLKGVILLLTRRVNFYAGPAPMPQ
jgi:hypothetical protein